MENEAIPVALKARLEHAEKRIDSLDRQLLFAKIAGGVLAVLGITGGVILDRATTRLQALTEKSDIVEGKLRSWDTQVKEATDRLTAKEVDTLDKVRRGTTAVLEEANGKLAPLTDLQLNRITAASEQATAKIEQAGLRVALTKLQDGSSVLRLRALEIINQSGKTVAYLGPGNDDIVAELRIADAEGRVHL